MTQKIAVAVVHGIGIQGPEFVDKIHDALNRQFSADVAFDMVIEPVHWAQAIQVRENDLWQRIQSNSARLDFRMPRWLLVHFIADAFGYQLTTYDRTTYDSIHAEFGKTLHHLAEQAGENAPLCIISHSLGTVIASNFIYDLQNPHLITPALQAILGTSPLAKGETLAMFYTLGSPLALWSLPYDNYGTPVKIPDPRLIQHYPQLVGEWVNYYDKDDIIGFPLRGLNALYRQEVNADVEVNIGNRFVNWTPLAHVHYWDEERVVSAIANTLDQAWVAING